jgi:hypothetical protein
MVCSHSLCFILSYFGFCKGEEFWTTRQEENYGDVSGDWNIDGFDVQINPYKAIKCGREREGLREGVRERV